MNSHQGRNFRDLLVTSMDFSNAYRRRRNVAREKDTDGWEQKFPRHTVIRRENSTMNTPSPSSEFSNRPGTPNDRAVFVNIEGFYLMDGHAKPLEKEGVTGTAAVAVEAATQDENQQSKKEFLPISVREREVTAILVKTVQSSRHTRPVRKYQRRSRRPGSITGQGNLWLVPCNCGTHPANVVADDRYDLCGVRNQHSREHL